MRFTLLIISALILSACSVTPVKVTQEQIDLRVMQQSKWIENTQMEITGPLSLSDAVILALKHNLEIEQARYRVLVGQTALNHSVLGYLPQLNSNSNRYVRNNDGGAVDVLPPARDKNSSSTTISWSSLDLGQAYLRAQELGNEALMEEQQQRRVLTRIVREVLSAYVELAAIEQEIEQSRQILMLLDRSLARVKLLENSHLVDPLVLLQYREQLLRLRIQLEDLELDYLSSKQELMTLISAPGLEVSIVHKGQNTFNLSLDGTELKVLERFALYHRSDLMESMYQIKNAGLEIKRAWLDALPNFSVGYSSYYDSDPNLRNSEWLQVDLNLAIKVIELLTLPAKLDELEKRQALEQLASLANAVAIVGQIRAANIAYQTDKKRLAMESQRTRTLEEIFELRQQRLSYELMDELDLYKAQVQWVIAKVKKAQAYSQYQRSILRILEESGVDLFPTTSATATSSEFKTSVEHWLRDLPSNVSQLLAQYNGTPKCHAPSLHGCS
ncbi:TolC family protein [Vibrio nomapromontoriensis]|uniref:TolC family protein n=1 Tax=Vibrio nomapromontoriensis TaxID=2910246 RepID=UPI003D11645C